MAAPRGGSAVCPPGGGATGAAFGAGVAGAGLEAGAAGAGAGVAGVGPVCGGGGGGGGGTTAPAGGRGGATAPAGGRGGGAIFSRSFALSISSCLSRSCCCMAGPAGGFGGAGGGAAAGGGTCAGGAATGGAGGAGRGGGGGAGLGGGAATGGAGRAGGAPFFCGSLGGCLGFPSGPSSSRACATTSGAVCACDGAAVSCSAVRAVVASSKSRSFVMMAGVPGKFLATRFVNKLCQQTLAINKQALGRIVASFKREFGFISDNAKSGCAFVHCAFRRSFQIGVLHFPLAALRCTLGHSYNDARKAIFPSQRAQPGA